MEKLKAKAGHGAPRRVRGEGRGDGRPRLRVSAGRSTSTRR